MCVAPALGRRIRNSSENGIYFPSPMAKKLLCYLIFFVLETLIVLGSTVAVVCLYLPFVGLKAIVLTAMGKSSSKAPPEPSIPETNA